MNKFIKTTIFYLLIHVIIFTNLKSNEEIVDLVINTNNIKGLHIYFTNQIDRFNFIEKSKKVKQSLEYNLLEEKVGKDYLFYIKCKFESLLTEEDVKNLFTKIDNKILDTIVWVKYLYDQQVIETILTNDYLTIIDD